MKEFLETLRRSGDVIVTPEGMPELDDTIREDIVEHELAFRANLMPGAPPLELEAAYWALGQLYRACQFLVIRDVEEDMVRSELRGAFGGDATASVHYSVDLCFSYLPSLHRLATRVAPKDALVEMIERLAGDWPLSSVGIESVSVSQGRYAFLDVPCLRRLYVDRVLAAEDVARLEHDGVARAARASLGAWPELRPKVNAYLLETRHM